MPINCILLLISMWVRVNQLIKVQWLLFWDLNYRHMDAVERVDNLVRQNLVKYTEQKYQEQYQKQLQQYEKQRKREALREYARIIQSGNKRAVDKHKMMEQRTRKQAKTKNKAQLKEIRSEAIESSIPVKKSKFVEEDIKKIQQAIQTRAEKLLQQRQLEKLNTHLEKQRKRTKLYQLDQKCRAIAKSSTKLPQSATELVLQPVHPGQTAKYDEILHEYEARAQQQIDQLDRIISGIVEKKKKSVDVKGGAQRNPTSESNSRPHTSIPSWKIGKNDHEENKEESLEDEEILFTKTTQELLSLEYIPI